MNSHTPFWVNDCLIDLEHNLISVDGQARSVEPRVMAVLFVLFESMGRVVSRDELISQVWGDRVTSDSSLSRNVALLRKLLDKPEQSGSCIKTFPKKGYMLLESFVRLENDSVLAAEENTEALPNEVHNELLREQADNSSVNRDLLEDDANQGEAAPDAKGKNAKTREAVAKGAEAQATKVSSTEVDSEGTDKSGTEGSVTQQNDADRIAIAEQSNSSTPTINRINSGTSLLKSKGLWIGLVLIVINVFGLLYLYSMKKSEQVAEEPTKNLIRGSWLISPEEPEAAFCFDGLDDFVEFPSQPAVDIGTEDFSLSAWIKTTTSDVAVIMDKRNEQLSGDVKGYNFHVLRGNLGMQLADGDGEWRCIDDPSVSSCTNFYAENTIVADDQWHFLTVTVDRDNPRGLRMYVDGELVKIHNPTSRMGSLSNDFPLRVGSRSSDKSAFFPGQIGEVNIYHYVLTPEAVKQQFSIGNRRTCGRG